MPDENDIRTVRKSTLTGDPDSSLFNMFYGPNHFGSNDLVPINQDTFAYIFFTKPNLNLSKANIGHVRKLQYLLNQGPNTIANAVKCSLSTKFGWNEARDGSRSDAINDDYPFIPFLSSSIESVSGFPDEAMEFFQSEEGMAKQVYGYADGRPENFGTFQLQFVFNSKIGDPHKLYLGTLHQYMGLVGTGEISPKAESENEFETDYFTNVYIIITDRNKQYVQKLACLGGGGLWEGVPSGQDFNIDKATDLQLEGRQINAPMLCFGFRYNDPIIIENFNYLVRAFKKPMGDVQMGTPENTGMVQIPHRQLSLFGNRGYPFINPDTSELEWWIESSIYEDRTS